MKTRRMAGIFAALTGVVAGGVAALRKARSPRPAARAGTFSNGIEYQALGTGPRTMLFLPGGPGTPSWNKAMARSFLPAYVTGDYTVWWLSRRRNMPKGHTIADMADDVAQVIDELGGQVDAVVGAAFGGMIALHLAARHPDRVGRVVLLASAAVIPDHVKEIDRRFGEALGKGRYIEAAEAGLVETMPGKRLRGLRRLAASLAGRGLASMDYNLPDVLVETLAELDYDARPVLPQITAPVLIIAGEKDQLIPRKVIEETARSIPDCSVIWQKGHNHQQTIQSRRTRREVLAFLNRGSTRNRPAV